MKGNIKKLAVFVILAAIAMFMVVATASGDGRNSHLLRGTYAFTGSGNCVVSFGGVNLFTLIQIWEGEYTFDGHGSGSFTGTFRAVDLNPGAPNHNAISKAKASWLFNYEMTGHNRFETYLKPGTYDKVEDLIGSRPDDYFDIDDRFYGAVERDGASIVITSGPPMIHYQCVSNPPPDKNNPCVRTGVEALCSESVVGLKVRE